MGRGRREWKRSAEERNDALGSLNQRAAFAAGCCQRALRWRGGRRGAGSNIRRTLFVTVHLIRGGGRRECRTLKAGTQNNRRRAGGYLFPHWANTNRSLGHDAVSRIPALSLDSRAQQIDCTLRIPLAADETHQLPLEAFLFVAFNVAFASRFSFPSATSSNHRNVRRRRAISTL